MMVCIHILSRMAGRFANRPMSGYLVSLVLLSCYYPLFLYPNGVLTETLFVFFSVGAIYALSRGIPSKDTFIAANPLRAFGIGGTLFAGAALVRPTILPYPLLLGALLFVVRRDLRKPVLGLLVVFFVLMAPWFIRNTSIYGKPVYTSVSGGNLYKVNRFDKPLTYTGRVMDQLRSRPDPEWHKKTNTGRMKNQLSSFLTRDDVERNDAYTAQALKNLRWHTDYELGAFLEKKWDKMVPTLLQGATTEYIVDHVRFFFPPLFVHNFIHVLFLALALYKLVVMRFRGVLTEALILTYVGYFFAVSLFVPFCPRMMLPPVVFLLYFTLKWAVELPVLRSLMERIDDVEP